MAHARPFPRHAVNDRDLSDFSRALTRAERADRLPLAAAGLAEMEAGLAAPAAGESLPIAPELAGDPGIGFLELIRPWIERARGRLRAGIERIGRTESLPFDPMEAERMLAETLPYRLLGIFGRTLVLEMNVARLQGLLAGETPEERFAAFVERLRRPEVAAAIFQEYPVIARQVVHGLAQWVETSLELLERLGG